MVKVSVGQPPQPARAWVVPPPVSGSSTTTVLTRVLVIVALPVPEMADEPTALRATSATPATMAWRRRFQLVPSDFFVSFTGLLSEVSGLCIGFTKAIEHSEWRKGQSIRTVLIPPAYRQGPRVLVVSGHSVLSPQPFVPVVASRTTSA